MRHPRSAATLPAYDKDSGDLNAIVETTKGNRNKFTFDEELGLFTLTGILPAGATFPFDFGFVPSTLGGDGDPLDVLLLMDEPAFTGCLVPARLIGVITARQTERDGTTERNDRLIAVAAKSRTHEEVRALDDLSAVLLDEIEHFFVSYNEIKGKKFEPTGRKGPHKAAALVQEGEERFAKKRRNGTRAGAKGKSSARTNGSSRRRAGH
jgi:inorganic pyrophosphatase